MNWSWAASLDQLWQSPAFPVLLTLGVGAFFALVLLVALFRAEKSIANGALAVITLLALTVAVTASVRGFGGGERTVAEVRQVPQGAISLPALACLDGLAGESVEAACEKALFASAESAAAAVSYTAMQITRLAAHGDVATANGAMTPELATLRRVIERDRYGLAAQVLLTREQCSPTTCDLYRSLTDRKQVSGNMAERAYEGYVGRHAATWGAPSQTAASQAPALAGLPASAPTGRPTNADFPTAASIPPVNIMGNEPPAGAAAAPPPAARAAAPPPQTQQVPAAALAPPSPNPARASAFPPPPQQAAPRSAAAAAPAPTTTAAAPPAPAAAKKQAAAPAPKQQRTSAPVQLAPPAEPDDN